MVREKREASSEVADSSLVGCGTVSTGKGECPTENIACICSIEQWKNEVFLF